MRHEVDLIPPPPSSCVTCIDDRYLLELAEIPDNYHDILILDESQFGPQIPGGSIGILVVLAELAPAEKKLSFDELYELAKKAHNQAGFEMGIHIDDDHGEDKEVEILNKIASAVSNPSETKLAGCGYARMLTEESNPLSLSERSRDLFNSINILSMMVSKGAKVAVLSGSHANPDNDEAFAISNLKQGTILNRAKLKGEGVKVYGHDPLYAQKILQEAVKILREQEEIEWADNLDTKGANLEKTHHRIAIRILTGKEPVEIY